MKTKKQIIGIILLLLMITSVLVSVNLLSRDKIPKGAIMVDSNDSIDYIFLSRLTLSEVSGTMVNGRGEQTYIRAQGIPLFLLTDEGCRFATVIASDEYRAVVSADETDSAFLFLCEDGSTRLIVFGDDSAKRDVKNVEKVEFR